MLVATTRERAFSFTSKGQTINLPDPNIEMSPEAVMNFYSPQYPELITSKLTGPVLKDDKFTYKFDSVMGTKG